MHTEDDIRKLSKAQRRALDRLCMGQPPLSPRRTMVALVARGLVVARRRQDRTLGIAVFSWTEYEVPINVHMAWCKVGSEEYDAMTPEERTEAEA